MAYIEVINPVSIRLETSKRFELPGDTPYYRVHAFEYDENTRCSIICDGGIVRQLEPKEALEITLDEKMECYAYDVRALVCKEFEDKSSTALMAYSTMAVTAFGLYIVGKD